MEARFINGSSVNRVYGDETATEHLGVFQYAMDAEAFAKMKLAEDANRNWFDSKYIVSCGHNGEIKIFKPDPPKKVDSA